MSKVWLYLGIILVCSGIGTSIGILLVIFYFWGDIKEGISNINSTTNDIPEEKYKQNCYSEDTAEEMK
jgi:hypothetical protein